MTWSAILGAIGIALGFMRRNSQGSSTNFFGSPTRISDHDVPLFQGIAETYNQINPALSHAATLALKSDIPGATKLFGEALQLSTNDSDLCLLACQIYRALWMNELVEKFDLRGLELTPGDVDALVRFHPYFPNNLRNGLKTHALTVEDTLKVAELLKMDMIAEWNCMHHAMELDDHNAEVCRRYVEQHVNGDNGDYYEWIQESDDLFAIALRAQELDPNEPRTAFLLASMHYEYDWQNNGNYLDAHKWILRAIELEPNNQEFLDLQQEILREIYHENS